MQSMLSFTKNSKASMRPSMCLSNLNKCSNFKFNHSNSNTHIKLKGSPRYSRLQAIQSCQQDGLLLRIQVRDISTIPTLR